MMPFQLHTLARVLRSLAPSETADAAALRRRLALLIGCPPLALSTSLALSLDARLFPVDRVQVRQPLFVVGPPRSGTTRLFRLLAQDTARFTSLKLWQILFPSLIQQRLIRGVLRHDTGIATALRQAIDRAQTRALGGLDALHRTRLEEPEEDELLLIHTFASEILAVAFPHPAALDEYRDFDRLPEPRRRALMDFYAGCIRRHLLLEGPDRQLLSKNIVFCNKVGSIAETFPDAGFVLALRHPGQTIPSLVSLVRAIRQGMGIPDPGDTPRLVDFVLDCYHNALASYDRLPERARLLVQYTDLVRSPRAVVTGIYRHFGWEIGPAFAARLEDEEEVARRYHSQHRYPLEAEGLRQGEIQERAAAIYARFGYAPLAG